MTELSDYRRLIEAPMLKRWAVQEKCFREALRAARPEIERQRDRCNSDEEVEPYEKLLTQIDAALAQS